MYDRTPPNLKNHQIRHQATHKVGCQSGDYIINLHMVTLIFLMGLCGYVWGNILTLSPPRVVNMEEWYVMFYHKIPHYFKHNNKLIQFLRMLKGLVKFCIIFRH